MKRYVGFLLFILVLAPVESTLPRLPMMHGLRGLFLVPLVLFFALRLNTVEGLILSYVAGFVEDATVAYTSGLAAFTLVALFLGAKVALAAIRADGPLFEAFFAFMLAASFFAVTQGLRRALEPGLAPLGDDWAMAYVVPCFVTAVIAPFITQVAKRIDRLQAKTPGAL
jgi:cell shape-determining protein MreD